MLERFCINSTLEQLIMKPKKIEKIFVEHGFKKWARLLTQIPFLGLKKHSWSKKLRFKGQPDWKYIFRWRGLVSSKILTSRTCSVRLVNTMRIGRSWVPTSIRRAVFFLYMWHTYPGPAAFPWYSCWVDEKPITSYYSPAFFRVRDLISRLSARWFCRD